MYADLQNVGYQFLLGDLRFLGSFFERFVDVRELAPHVVGALVQAEVDVGTDLLRLLPFLFRPLDVLLGKLRPTFRVRHSIEAHKK